MGRFKYLSDEDAHNPWNSYFIQHEENKKVLKNKPAKSVAQSPIVKKLETRSRNDRIC